MGQHADQTVEDIGGAPGIPARRLVVNRESALVEKSRFLVLAEVVGDAGNCFEASRGVRVVRAQHLLPDSERSLEQPF